MVKSKIILNEKISKLDDFSINNPILDGYHFSKFKDYLLESNSEEACNHILANSFQSIYSFKNPDGSFQNKPLKVLCLGKVQSGKTSFFLGSISLAFDNGYDVAYVLGGTKLKLKEQNLGRINESFKNNKKVLIFDVNKSFNVDLNKLIAENFKVILVILKNASENTNLGKLKELSDLYSNIPSIIVDDEGDEFSPGAERSKKTNNKAGKTHDKIADIITSFKICTFLSVTATPQANLLISTFDELSPNRLVLVQPGKGYTGGHEFFDTDNNPHVINIEDTDDFIDSIPTSFKSAFYFYIFSCALKRCSGDFKSFSMLVHPSSFSSVHDIVASRINNFLNDAIFPSIDQRNRIAYDDICLNIANSLREYNKLNGDCPFTLDQIMQEVNKVISLLKIQVINFNSSDLGSDDEFAYKIKIGGNMLGRGLTIDRLIVSYIYRDSKESQVDTMYQRCRWFGYKSSYFDVCRVYMTPELRNKFIAIVSSEDHMWMTLKAFMETHIDLKKFQRVFLLENDKLILTRRSISNTVTLKCFSSGNRADECIDLSQVEKEQNRDVFNSFFDKYKNIGKQVDFDNSIDHRQRHMLMELNFKDVYEDFLSKLHFGYGSPFSNSLFQTILNKIENGYMTSQILVMVMRFENGEYRSTNDGITISRLFQGRNDQTQFKGDRYPEDIHGNQYQNVPFIQIHLVSLESNEDLLKEAIPLISFNNPFTGEIIKLVTGDNVYEE